MLWFCCLHIGKGVPNRLAVRNNFAQHIQASVIPSPEDAVSMFEGAGGNLTLISQFGSDPLVDRSDLFQMRQTEFFSKFPDFSPIFYTLSNGNDHMFRAGLKLFLELTERFTP